MDERSVELAETIINAIGETDIQITIEALSIAFGNTAARANSQVPGLGFQMFRMASDVAMFESQRLLHEELELSEESEDEESG